MDTAFPTMHLVIVLYGAAKLKQQSVIYSMCIEHRNASSTRSLQQEPSISQSAAVAHGYCSCIETRHVLFYENKIKMNLVVNFNHCFCDRKSYVSVLNCRILFKDCGAKKQPVTPAGSHRHPVPLLLSLYQHLYIIKQSFFFNLSSPLRADVIQQLSKCSSL